MPSGLTGLYDDLVLSWRRDCAGRTVLRTAMVSEVAIAVRAGEEMRLLIIEDNKTLARSLRQGFQEEGFAVDVALDGEEGLWYAQSNPYDVVVLDLTLPRLDGLELLRQIRSRGVASHVIVSARPTHVPCENDVSHTPRQIERMCGMETDRIEEDENAGTGEAAGRREGAILAEGDWGGGEEWDIDSAV
ncbi:MAG: response regulator, partial [bacterium]|nr:response regulator [bacterium]